MSEWQTLKAVAFALMMPGLFAPALPAAADENDDERRMHVVRITAPSPWIGTLHVKLVVSAGSEGEAAAPKGVELLFVPVINDDDGKLSPAVSSEEGKQTLSVGQGDIALVEPHRRLPTKKILLAPGEYILSQVRYLGAGGETIGTYCMSERTIGFDIYASDLVFLGQLQLKPPGMIERDGEQPQVFSQGYSLDDLKGWRRQKDQLSGLVLHEASFEPSDLFCPNGGLPVAAWLD